MPVPSPLPSISRACRLRVRTRTLARVAALATTTAVLAAAAGFGASSSTVVTADIPSATTLVTTGCPPLDATRTSLGVVVPGSPAITAADCDVLFGSSNDTATLRTYQPDNRGSAMASNATTMTSAGSSNRMLDVDMATASIGWAVGEGTANARLYKTTDGGDSWVAVTDANDGLDGGAEGVDAVSTTIAWAARTNTNEVSRTTNGTNWSKITIEEFPAAQVNRIVAGSDTHAWALGCEVVAGTCRARIWRTFNGGVDWFLAFSDPTPNADVSEGVALSNTHVFAATTTGSGQGIIESTDGMSFTTTSASTASFRDVDSYDGVHVAAGTTGGAVHVSDDGGDTWTVRNPSLDLSIRGIDYDSSGTIVIGGVDGSMARSPDDGQNWASIDQDVIGGRLHSLDAVGSRIFATFNSSSIARSHDDGGTWLLNSQAVVSNWTGVDGVDGGRIWRVGGPGHIQVSTDGGLTWTAQTSGTTELLTDVHALSRTSAIVVGTDGTILHTTNSGTTWVPVASPAPTKSLVTVAGAPPPYDDTIWASGRDNTLIRSTDGGASWSAVTGPAASNVTISAVAAWNERDLIIGTTGPSSRIWTSNDGGASWQVRAGSGTLDGVMDLVAVPETQIALAIDDMSGRRTTDGGATWTSMSVTSGSTLAAVDLAPDNRTIWATGDFGATAVSTNAGATWTQWSGGPTSKMGFGVLALSPTSMVQVSDGNGSKTSDVPNGVPDYDGGAASWSGTGFFGICLRAAPGAGSTWPTDGTCDQGNGGEWRAIPLHGGLASASTATTLGPGTTTASFRFGMKAPSSQAPGTYVAPVTFELTAPSG